jgi:hypothetical protein
VKALPGGIKSIVGHAERLSLGELWKEAETFGQVEVGETIWGGKYAACIKIDHPGMGGSNLFVRHQDKTPASALEGAVRKAEQYAALARSLES